ncbi:MAG: alginate export family protein, partial [Candidatus Omnitrophica bacterium]|nr:alginate export family protein [Candidatus Omnitrophota bacterium]
MSRRLILVLVLAFVLGISFAAYAEVQNVKVSGDLTMMGVVRENFDLTKTAANGWIGGSASNRYDDTEKDLLSIVRVRVDADLTDNVSTTIRLLNERNWNGESATGVIGANRNIGFATDNGAAEEQDIELDLAYVHMKEFLYSPLSLTVGRQELHFGNDFIIGDPDTNMVALRSSLAEGDLSSRKAFDAIRATLDYNPLVVDIVYAKLAENNVVLNDDTTVYGLNLNYALDKNTTLEGFYFGKIRGSDATAVTNVDSGLNTSFIVQDNGKSKSDQVHTVGARVVNRTINNLTVDAQAAYQFGTYNPKFDPNARFIAANNKAEIANRRAWAAEGIATYDLKDVKYIGKYNPSLSAIYLYLSGADRDRTGSKTYKGWDAMYENQTLGHIINAIMGFSNAHFAGLSAKAKPMDDVTVKMDAVAVWFAKRFPDQRLAILSGVDGAREFRMAKGPFIGQEYDLTLTYDYTEDVQFSLLGGLF